MHSRFVPLLQVFNMDYWEIELVAYPRNPFIEIFMLELAEWGCDAFSETDDGILAYAPCTKNIDDDLLAKVLEPWKGECEFQWIIRRIPYQNWNAQWESEFEPVQVEHHATILAPFHKNVSNPGISILVQPRMSFGTGHHPTTWMMVKALFELEQMPANVLDMGTGTGVLAIVCEKLGAKRILAADIEEEAVENAVENAERNACKQIEFLCADAEQLPDLTYGLIVANINKNVLRAHFPHYHRQLIPGGLLLISGFFQSDVKEITDICNAIGLEKITNLTKENWASLLLKKT
jgi:ribosomal protein L11 methyltransferase